MTLPHKIEYSNVKETKFRANGIDSTTPITGPKFVK